MSDKIFFREKGKKAWIPGWICERQGQKIRIGSYVGDPFSRLWYDTWDIEIQERG